MKRVRNINFNPKFYAKQYPELKLKTSQQAFNHWMKFGKNQGKAINRNQYLHKLKRTNRTNFTQEKFKEGLHNLQKNLKINNGSFKEEYEEQLMTFMHLKNDAVVLELGGNVGRNSLIIASILLDDKKYVSMECDKKSAQLLKNNRDLNKMSFHIEDKALSYRRI